MELVQLICRFLVKVHGITVNVLPESFSHMGNICKKEKFLPEVDQDDSRELLDALMLLANGKVFLRLMDDIKIYQLFDVLKVKPFGESRDKIDVISAQIAAIDMPDVPENDAEDLD